MRDVELSDYNYELPSDRIAQYPLPERDLSQLLIYKENSISRDIFRNIPDNLPSGSLLIFNNSRVIRAQIFFTKKTGATIEILCIEPLSPSEYELSFSSRESVEWKCIIGNLKKWKNGLLTTPFIYNGKEYNLIAEKIRPEGEAWRIRFNWTANEVSFADVIEATGHIPLPPYINREDDADDINRYQTIYSSINGSIAAPTAGLHFTENVLKGLIEKGIKTIEIT